MTEAEWLTSNIPSDMLDALKTAGRLTERKAKLFGCSCCRRISHLLKDEDVERALAIAERVADGEADSRELQMVLGQIQQMANGYPPASTVYAGTMGVVITNGVPPEQSVFRLGLSSLANAVAWNAEPNARVIEDGWSSPRVLHWQNAWSNALSEQAQLLREVFCDPFQPLPAIARDRLTETVVALAQAAYGERMPDGTLDNERLCVLADALEEGGGAAQDVLEHLRGPGPHVRGCWAVDLVLSKK